MMFVIVDILVIITIVSTLAALVDVFTISKKGKRTSDLIKEEAKKFKKIRIGSYKSTKKKNCKHEWEPTFDPFERSCTKCGVVERSEVVWKEKK